MLNKNKKIQTLIVLFLMAICGCTAPAKLNDKRIIKAEEAKKIAIDYLLKQDGSNQYMISSAEVRPSEEANMSWQVTFKHVNWKQMRPGFGLVNVDGKTGEPSWVPLR